jgi:hypothetical protein
MDASDLIKALQNTLRGGGRPHMENRVRSRDRCRPVKQAVSADKGMILNAVLAI